MKTRKIIVACRLKVRASSVLREATSRSARMLASTMASAYAAPKPCPRNLTGGCKSMVVDRKVMCLPDGSEPFDGTGSGSCYRAQSGNGPLDTCNEWKGATEPHGVRSDPLSLVGSRAALIPSRGLFSPLIIRHILPRSK